MRETAIADIQQDIVKAERGVNIADLQAQADIKQAQGQAEGIRLPANGEAEAIRAKGEAQADAYKAGAEAMGSQGYTAVQLMQIVGESGVRIIPDIMVGSGSNGSSGSGSMIEALLGMLLRREVGEYKEQPLNGHTPNIEVTKE